DVSESFGKHRPHPPTVETPHGASPRRREGLNRLDVPPARPRCRGADVAAPETPHGASLQWGHYSGDITVGTFHAVGPPRTLSSLPGGVHGSGREVVDHPGAPRL